MNEPLFNVVMVILAMGTFIQPLFFGTLFLFMFKWFPTRREIELQEANQQNRHLENQERFRGIEDNIVKLLER